jgi:hypothetical protein
VPLKPGSIVLFGEWHGTQETPAYFAKTAVHVAKTTGQKIIVAIEWPQNEQSRLDKFLNETDESIALTQLRAADSFMRKISDGRTSKAMQQLLIDIRRGQRQGLDLQFLAFDESDTQNMTDDQRDHELAKNLIECIKKHDKAIVMVLTGNIHARTTLGVPWNKNFKPMGAWLKEELPGQLTSLNVLVPPGTAWTCSTLTDCGSKPNGMSEMAKDLPELEILPKPTVEGYDGVVRLPASTASKPAYP